MSSPETKDFEIQHEARALCLPFIARNTKNAYLCAANS